MQIIQTIWTAMTTPNETMVTILCSPLYFIEAIVNMLLFTTVLNIQCSKKSKIIYVICISLLAIISRTLIPDPYGTFLNMLIIIFVIKFILKSTFLKALLAEFIMIALSSILELFMFKFYQTVLNIQYDNIMTIPIYRFIFTSSIYLCIYLIYRIIKYFKFNIKLENMTRKNKILFIVNAFLGILAMGTQFYLLFVYL